VGYSWFKREFNCLAADGKVSGILLVSFTFSSLLTQSPVLSRRLPQSPVLGHWPPQSLVIRHWSSVTGLFSHRFSDTGLSTLQPMFTGNVYDKSGQLCTAVSRVFSHGQQLGRSEASHHYQGSTLGLLFFAVWIVRSWRWLRRRFSRWRKMA